MSGADHDAAGQAAAATGELRGSASPAAADHLARSLADARCSPLAPASCTAVPDRAVTLELAGPPLPPGIHRLEATVSIYGHRHHPGDPPLARRRVLGDLVHVAARPARQPAS